MRIQVEITGLGKPLQDEWPEGESTGQVLLAFNPSDNGLSGWSQWASSFTVKDDASPAEVLAAVQLALRKLNLHLTSLDPILL